MHISTLPASLETLLAEYQNQPLIEDSKEVLAQKVLTLASIQAMQNKIAYQQNAIFPSPKNTYDLSKKQAIDEATEYTLHRLFKNEEDEIIRHLLEHFDAHTWQFPLALIPKLLDYGSKKQRFAPSILNIVGQRGLWLAQYNPKWEYLLKAQAIYNAPESKSTPPQSKPINENILHYVQTHIFYKPSLAEDKNSRWEFNIPSDMTAQLKACGIKNNLYTKYNIDGNRNSYIIQLMQAVNPIHWIGENCADKVTAYVQLLSSFHFEAAYTCKALFLALQKAATLYQDKDLIIAQHIHISKTSSLWYEEIDNIIGKDNSNLFNNQEKEMISAYYIDNILNDLKDLPDNHPFICFLSNWDSWTENVTLLSVRKLSKLYHKFKYFNYALLALIKRAAYSIPYHLHDALEQIWLDTMPDGKIPYQIVECLNIIKDRQTLAKYCK